MMFDFFKGPEIETDIPEDPNQEILEDVALSQAFRRLQDQMTTDEVQCYVNRMIEKYGIASYAIMDGGADHLLPQQEI